ncbi:MAG: GldG family protein [Proteobacteria bacterium]|nr:DUF4350 domain-containing protein [Desulfobulbaceae bacterium]MBU4153297.1 GldG family protein [Pseudomonadota bacterium]MDP2106268.1 hypothetical protein [Desulfobulbaceae bacterium]
MNDRTQSRELSPTIKKIGLICLMASLLTIGACKRVAPPPVVLFDQSHGQQFLVENDKELDLSQLGEIFTAKGFQVKSSPPDQAFTDNTLHGVSTLIISGAFKPINDSEITVIKKFLDNGGQVCVMLHIGSPVTALLNNLGVAVSNGVIREHNNMPHPENPTDFFVANFPTHPLTKNLTHINLYGTWALNSEHQANIIAKTTPQAWVDLNGNKTFDSDGDAIQAFTVIVTGQLGHGHFVVFGDDAIFQNRFLVGPNQQLAINLVEWLKNGSYY